MDQNKLRNQKKLPTALDQDAMRQVKGGYREIGGVNPGATFVRWDEITIRLDDETGSYFNPGSPLGGGTFNPGPPTPSAVGPQKLRP